MATTNMIAIFHSHLFHIFLYSYFMRGWHPGLNDTTHSSILKTCTKTDLTAKLFWHPDYFDCGAALTAELLYQVTPHVLISLGSQKNALSVHTIYFESLPWIKEAFGWVDVPNWWIFVLLDDMSCLVDIKHLIWKEDISIYTTQAGEWDTHTQRDRSSKHCLQKCPI